MARNASEVRTQRPSSFLIARSHFGQDRRVGPFQCIHLLSYSTSITERPHDLLQRIGGLAHGTHHDHQIIQREMLEHLGNIAYASGILHTGTSELEDFH